MMTANANGYKASSVVPLGQNGWRVMVLKPDGGTGIALYPRTVSEFTMVCLALEACGQQVSITSFGDL